MTPETSSRRQRIVALLIILSAVAMVVGWSYFTANQDWTLAMQRIGAFSFLLWWVPGLVGFVLILLSLRRR